MKRAFTLVSTLATIAIILVLMVVLFKGSSLFGLQKGQGSARPDGKGTTVLGAAEYDARDQVCRSNLSQVRQAIQVFQSTNDDHFPQSLTETKLGSDFYSCPLGHEPYRYDPSTGQVGCVHPGHERY